MRHEKLAELIELARHLAASAEGLTIDEMASVARVSRRTAERMRDTLAYVFPQLEEVLDPPTKRFRIPSGLDSFSQVPTTEELLELGKAAAQLDAAGAASRAAVLQSLERKVRSAMRRQALQKVAPDVEALVRAEAIAVQAGPRPHEDPQLIAALRFALTAMRKVRFRYLGGRTPGESRTVTPYGLMFSRMNYLVAAEEGPHEPRNWRLDRIIDLEVLDAGGSPPPEFNLQDYASRSFGIYQDEVLDIVLRISSDRADDARRWRFHPTQSLEERADGSVVVRFRASGVRELTWHLFTWGDSIEVVEPMALQEALIAELELVLAKHRSAAKYGVAAP